MHEITYTLLGDGSSDKALMPIIDWTIKQHFPNLVAQRQWADLTRIGSPPGTNPLAWRIQQAINLYPCDWLFVHRDAEGNSIDERRSEINQARQLLRGLIDGEELISVVPVRMTEAWLLFDEFAIRKAAGNPNGRHSIQLPQLDRLERLIDPKETLKELLRRATGLEGRRLQKFNESRAIHLVADTITNFSPLRRLDAFRIFEKSVGELPLRT